MDNINQLLVQAQAAYNVCDWSSLIQCLQQLIQREHLEHPEILNNREHLLELALSVLETGDFQERWEIAKVIVRLNSIAIPRLIDILKDEDADEELRTHAARILGDLKNLDAIPPLVELLKTNESDELKEIAAAALGQMGSVAIAPLTELLAEEQTRLLATQMLSLIRQKETITPLLSVVQDPQVAVRVVAIEALSSFHDHRVQTVLLNALKDVAAPVRREAVLGLGFRPELRETFDLVAKLQPRLYDIDQEVCCAAVVALSRMGCDAAAQALFQVLISPNTPRKLQLETIRALSWVGTLSGLEYLQTALAQLQTAVVWQEIVTVLGRVSGSLTDKAAEILLGMLQDNHPGVEIASIKSAIALSLGQLGKMQAMSALTEMLTDNDVQVRLHASAAIKKLDSETQSSE
ncbi:HEAT repeat-containing PBS lyase [Scytonema sp. HK-05]|uniref:HEAT repeat domain-containing protein n=1 Tax=Scytonema sp. HK-05 TaxID=1137095 RepID=UPI000935B8D7|nr:HEAT repeat domain-containing protein [Scytonema sp. HK-05]OKH56921.1 PBS lyase [Scytonema sp. HK-05]BAY45303.1 HEAT repeat-containing PBS lyase [Scytonema sp. HK-05]